MVKRRVRTRRALSGPKAVELPNIFAEYVYMKRLCCDGCGHPVEGDRQGSKHSPDGRMHDIWDTLCTNCGESRQIILSVPSLASFRQLGNSDS